MSGGDKRLVQDVFEGWCLECGEERDDLRTTSGLTSWAVDHTVRTGHSVHVLHQQIREFTRENTAHLSIRGGHARRAEISA
jgi:hypothetical protein